MKLKGQSFQPLPTNVSAAINGGSVKMYSNFVIATSNGDLKASTYEENDSVQDLADCRDEMLGFLSVSVVVIASLLF